MYNDNDNIQIPGNITMDELFSDDPIDLNSDFRNWDDDDEAMFMCGELNDSTDIIDRSNLILREGHEVMINEMLGVHVVESVSNENETFTVDGMTFSYDEITVFKNKTVI